MLNERTAEFEREWKRELAEFYLGSYIAASFKKRLAYLFDEEVPDNQKRSYTWSLYELMNCIHDIDLEIEELTIVDVAEDVEFLVDLWNGLAEKYAG